jgi:phosphoribosyl 1,2-cyclic phosphodiesterase
LPVTVTFWGVRGSIPTPQLANMGVGGNTSCVEIRNDDHVVIIDAGTGIQSCGRQLVSKNGNVPRDVWIFLSHFHWDHLQGLPFFEPLYRPDFRLHLASSGPAELTRARLQRLMQSPYFPVDWEATASLKEYYSVPTGGLDLGGLKVDPVPLNHPQGATGYRIAGPHGMIVYASDFEHGDPAGDLCVLESARDARLLVYDAQFTPQEYECAGRRGWGHSTWREGARIAKEANVQRLVLFHHDPAHTDVMMAEIQNNARQLFAHTDIAVEGSSFLIE